MIELAEYIASTCLNESKSLNECVLMEFWVDLDTTYTEENQWSNPDIRPTPLDKTLEKWLDRIEVWGKVNFIYVDPENKFKGSISKSKFLEKMSTTDLLKLYGKFRVELIGVDEMEFIREYIGLDTKKYKEIFKIKVDLRPELKKGFKWYDGIFN